MNEEIRMNNIQNESEAGTFENPTKSESAKKKGIIKKSNKKQKQPESKPMEFLSDSGIKILVGKNNIQNLWK